MPIIPLSTVALATGRKRIWRSCYDAGVILARVAFLGLTAHAFVGCDGCNGGSRESAPSAANGDAGVEAEAAPVALPCSGREIDLAVAVSDPACTVTSGIAKSTRAVFEIQADAGKNVLEQTAVRLDDGRVELRLLNRGTAPVTVPLSWHPKIPAFIVLADNPKEKAIYELEAPALSVDLDGGPATARFARVTIAAGGHAFARIAIDSKIAKRAGKAAGGGVDAGTLPSALGEGKWVLHIGQLVSDVDTGEPAMLPWVIEAHD